MKKICPIIFLLLLAASCNKLSQNQQPINSADNQVVKVVTSPYAPNATTTDSDENFELKFRTIKTVISPFDGSKLFIAGTYGGSDTEQAVSAVGACGGVDTPSLCYIFWNGGVYKPAKSFITMLNTDVGKVDNNSIKFIDNGTITFNAITMGGEGEGDGWPPITNVWKLNLWTRELKQITTK